LSQLPQVAQVETCIASEFTKICPIKVNVVSSQNPVETVETLETTASKDDVNRHHRKKRRSIEPLNQFCRSCTAIIK
jgi:hypothetical protein